MNIGPLNSAPLNTLPLAASAPTVAPVTHAGGLASLNGGPLNGVVLNAPGFAAPVPPPPILPATKRDRDVRAAIRDRLIATNLFNDVWFTGAITGFGDGGEVAGAVIDPIGGGLAAASGTGLAAGRSIGTGLGWDDVGDLLDFTSTVKVTLIARDEDPQIRDERAEQLLGILHNAINGRILVPGLTIPSKTIVAHWVWTSANPPERQIEATVSYGFLVPWNAWDVSD